MRRLAVYVVSVVVVLAGFFVVPLPLVTSSPGGATDVASLLSLEETVTPIEGELRLLTVYVKQPSLAETLRALVSDTYSLRRREAVIPVDIPRQEYFRLQREEFRRTFRVAAAVGMRAAGLDVAVRTAPQVVGVLEGSPADGRLRVGDVIRQVGGEPVASAEALANITRQAAVGDEFVLTVERGGETMDVTVATGRLPGLEQAGVGITLQTLEEDVDLPVDAELVDQHRIGGPSAGMMIALTVYDLLSEKDLAAGRVVTGTGTVDSTGAVGRVGSVREKTLAAVDAGADVMLVPSSQTLEARQAAEGRVEVIGVDTIEEAIAALSP